MICLGTDERDIDNQAGELILYSYPDSEQLSIALDKTAMLYALTVLGVRLDLKPPRNKTEPNGGINMVQFNNETFRKFMSGQISLKCRKTGGIVITDLNTGEEFEH